AFVETGRNGGVVQPGSGPLCSLQPRLSASGAAEFPERAVSTGGQECLNERGSRMRILFLAAALAAIGLAQEPKPAADNKEEIEQGIPITSELVRKSCSPCHKVDEKMRMSRISYRRTTPEGWEETVKRMVSLDGVHLEPAAARQMLKYLANNLGLAPEEAKPAAF